MIFNLSDIEKAKIVKEYSEYSQQHQQDPYDIPDDYAELYNSTNEGS